MNELHIYYLFFVCKMCQCVKLLVAHVWWHSYIWICFYEKPVRDLLEFWARSKYDRIWLDISYASFVDINYSWNLRQFQSKIKNIFLFSNNIHQVIGYIAARGRCRSLMRIGYPLLLFLCVYVKISLCAPVRSHFQNVSSNRPHNINRHTPNEQKNIDTRDITVIL